MAEPHVMDALRAKRSELSGIVSHLEQQVVQHRASLVHLDAAMRLFDLDLAPEATSLRPQRPRSAWFHPGECLWLIHDVLRELQCYMGQKNGCNGADLFCNQATRTEIGRPRFSMRLRAWTTTFTSAARRSSVRERSPLPITCLNRPIAASARARMV